MKYVCKECGSENVEHAMWVNPNHNSIGEVFGTWNQQDTSFCNDCEARGCVVEKAEPGQLRYEDQPKMSEEVEKRFKKFIEENAIVHIEDQRIAKAAFKRGWDERKVLDFMGTDSYAVLLELCSGIALQGHDIGAIAECVLTALHKVGFTKEEVEEHMSCDLLSWDWFEKRGIEPIKRYVG